MDGLALEQLVAFERIVREGSFSRAALALRIGQPAISTRIAALEATLGGLLFRRGRRIALTPLGEIFLPYARRALEVLAEGGEAIRLVQEGKRGRVTLAVLPSLASALIAPALARFMRMHPEVDCLIKTAEHESLLKLLLDGIIELALVAWPCPPALETELCALQTLHEPVVLAASPRHPLAKARQVSELDLVRLARPLYRLRWWPAHHPAVVRLTEQGHGVLDLPMETALQLTRSGVGAGFFTQALIADELRHGTLEQVEVRGLEPLSRKSALVRRLRDAPISPTTAALVAEIRAEAETLGLLKGARKRRS
jgi:LysR family transcriptional regulator, low CO2-responsive transcriptional regulator